jgi:hypothetical protein
MPLSLEHEGCTQVCRCARSYGIIGVCVRTIFDNLSEWGREGVSGRRLYVRGDKVDKQKVGAKRKNEDERNLPVLLREDHRQCYLGQSHAS